MQISKLNAGIVVCWIRRKIFVAGLILKDLYGILIDVVGVGKLMHVTVCQNLAIILELVGPIFN